MNEDDAKEGWELAHEFAQLPAKQALALITASLVGLLHLHGLSIEEYCAQLTRQHGTCPSFFVESLRAAAGAKLA